MFAIEIFIHKPFANTAGQWAIDLVPFIVKNAVVILFFNLIF